MPQQGLVGSRAVVDRRFAVLPPEGIPESVLPEWSATAARILAAPPMGARFAQYLLDVAPQGGTRQTLAPGIEGFLYVLSGGIRLDLEGRSHRLATGGFAFQPPGAAFAVEPDGGPARLLWLKKRYEPFGNARPAAVVGNEADVKGEPFLGIEELLLKTLLPVDVAYDMAMNVFTFPPGYALPMTETHVMEHGLWFLEGQGMYYLGDRWLEVKKDDFIWMGPYCPQSFFATGSTPSRYVYYKNVHRDVEL